MMDQLVLTINNSIDANSSTGQVAIKFGIEGPSLTITTACAASANAVGEAKNLIENGIVDMVVTGGTESF